MISFNCLKPHLWIGFFDKKLNLDIPVSLIQNSKNAIFDDFSHFLINLQELRTGGVYSLYLIIFAIFNVCIHSSKDLVGSKQHLKTFPNLFTALLVALLGREIFWKVSNSR